MFGIRLRLEIREVAFIKRLECALYRPFFLTFNELIIVFIALDLNATYAILFTFLTGYTFIFTEIYGFNQGITRLSFIGTGIGLCLTMLLVLLTFLGEQGSYKSRGKKKVRFVSQRSFDYRSACSAPQPYRLACSEWRGPHIPGYCIDHLWHRVCFLDMASCASSSAAISTSLIATTCIRRVLWQV